jgi:hypothetical protein
MRSRDGNSNLSRRLCSVALFYSLALDASEYLISYRYVVKDAILYNDTLQISKSMKKCQGTAHKSTLTLDTNDSKDLNKIISQNEQEFTSYIHKLGMHINYSDFTQNLQNHSTAVLTLKTTCFKVDFNDNFVRIAPLQ